MSRDDVDVGDPTPLSFRAQAERMRRRERNPADACRVNAASRYFLENFVFNAFDFPIPAMSRDDVDAGDPLSLCHSVYNNDGDVKGKRRRMRLRF
jgi:hypothetical protein